MGDTNWVGCSLTFNGKMYGCTVTGLSAPVTGIARVSGMVFGLKDPESFAGTYTSGNDVSLGGGHLALKNQKGVKMVLTAFGDLVELQAADKGGRGHVEGGAQESPLSGWVVSADGE
jgi:hypothetical protein